MARNKYPEVTVEKILTAAQKLFLEKGYENTTIQDIVDELGGLTKGAVYHHFKSKEDIINALCDKMLFENNPFARAKQRADLNGLEKIREVVRLNFQDSERYEMASQALPILKNPRILAEMIESNRKVLSPCWQELIEEGVRDGSLHTEYAKEIAELLPLITDIWASPSIYPATEEEMYRKFTFIRIMLERMGLPLIDDALLEEMKAFASKVYFPG
jgi:AcrR family transcriptional regulator